MTLRKKFQTHKALAKYRHYSKFFSLSLHNATTIKLYHTIFTLIKLIINLVFLIDGEMYFA